MNTIVKGSIVKFINPIENQFQGGYFKVTAVRGNTVNLGAIFGKTIYHKSVPVELLTESESAWYQAWQASDQYQCM